MTEEIYIESLGLNLPNAYVLTEEVIKTNDLDYHRGLSQEPIEGYYVQVLEKKTIWANATAYYSGKDPVHEIVEVK